MSTNKPIKNTDRRATVYRGTKCLNCTHPLDLSDVYCPYCSQLNTTKQLSLKDFLGEFFNSIVSYDSRLRYTLKDLLFRPGIATKNYVAGQRLKYANPFRFFLSVSIIYFLIQGLITSISADSNPFVNINETSSERKKENTTKNSPLIIATEKDTIIQARDAMNLIDSDTIKKSEKFTYYSEKQLDTMEWGERLVTRYRLYSDFYDEHKIKQSSKAIDSLNHTNTRFNRWLYSKNESIENIKEKPLEFVNYLMGKVPFFLFFFTPLFALFFWLIYSKKKHSYIEHVIFIFHIFSFLFLGMLIAIIPDLLFGNDIVMSVLFLLIGPFYFYKALRNFYQQKRLKTILKFVFLNFTFWISTTVAAFLFFLVTAAIY
ncbi:DUF3667 domain-containing protein [Patiriisocius hiemis]|uniref:DUF3667 domain-containing protein n=1 Tax=Patiriisocius hiemis TaxID=3075604 RepID=A0ABU2YFR2_9FLAO|nr:DUF3667 domain-containing protein [Constantimarinum sp. W242]MDT0556514.1 DUF3667 domain-containing protein [Constantimarinum sp. W242]